MRGDISARGYRLHRAESGDRHPGHPGRYGAGSLIPVSYTHLHCELTESYLEKLEAYGFDGVYIEDKLSEGITIESVITPQLRQEGQERIRACDIDGRCV